MLSSGVKEIMASCYNYGTQIKGFEQVIYKTWLYTLQMKRWANGMVTMSVIKDNHLHVATHIFKNMSDFRNIVL